ncbi:hypothetical protein FRACA_380043 [Frankia canadensis]|uniref:Uncharacterized protein n=1 Tax=Frankia canadensis TaxID=1836972 RepID=A0A2I2KW17_9ACTN|nr:hypothetical protein [Frankia canadensis]SNQ49852.1 hypothetical protein FRACA_380043 [Frankia canadensis]SOU57142.1 hypothetical protein FRACA_380043 [Frankia canadensis]
MRLWGPTSGQPHGPILTPGHTGPVRALAMLSQPDGTTLLASASYDHAVLVWVPADS